jgi:redox-sensitive bicupin YhaK (pirin superfamily)
MKAREVKRIVRGYATIDGAGVKLIRVLGHNDVNDIDPFLMMDHFGSDKPADYIKGFPMHPHRGIETITYLLEGRVDHKDSLGNGGTLLDGNLQWMTAGKGILHEEMPKETASKRLSGLQFWLNLPKKDKMAPPHYFPISPEMVKDIKIEGGKVKLISGEFLGEKGVEPKYVKATMMDVALNRNAEYTFPVRAELNAFAYIIDGAAHFGEQRTLAERHSAVIFGDGDAVKVHANESGVRFMLLTGKPLKEPIAWGGPIVMNTQEELRTAFAELGNGTFIR